MYIVRTRVYNYELKFMHLIDLWQVNNFCSGVIVERNRSEKFLKVNNLLHRYFTCIVVEKSV